MTRRYLKLSMTILMLTGVYLLSRQAAVYVNSLPQQEADKKPVIVIDAGHGGT